MAKTVKTSKSQKANSLGEQTPVVSGHSKKSLHQVKGAFSSSKLLHQQVQEASKKQAKALLPEKPIRLQLKDFPKKAPEFKAGVGKDQQIAEWLIAFIQEGFAQGTLHEMHLLPLKQDFSNYFGVSIGTVQNAIRFVEDEEWVESKQRIGTLLRNPQEQDASRIRKQTSKRDQAVLAIQNYILQQNFDVQDVLPSSRQMAKIIQSAPNTTRLAMEYLAHEGLLEAMGNRGKRPNWILQQLPNPQLASTMVMIETDTLIDQIERDLKALIMEEHEVNEKLPPHQELATRFNVSIKTVHDAMQRLVEQGFVHSKRGRYGTFVTRLPVNLINSVPVEQFFVPATEHEDFYNYEKAETQLRELLETQYNAGDKLPNIQELAQAFDLPTNSVRRGLKTLEQEGKISFKRGRYGGAIIR